MCARSVFTGFAFVLTLMGAFLLDKEDTRAVSFYLTQVPIGGWGESSLQKSQKTAESSGGPR